MQGRINARMWSRQELVAKYTGRALRPAEAMILIRRRDEIGPRVLDLGCGAGRLTGYLAEMAPEVHGIDVMESMLEACRESFPQVRTELRDMRDLSPYADGSFETVFAIFNVISVLSDADRRALLDEVRRVLTPDGLFVFSAHNRAAADQDRIPWNMKFYRQPPVRAAITLVRLPRWVINRRRVRPYERHEPGYALINDVSHDFGGLHYYISRAAQERQLAEHGFEVLECLDREGRVLATGDDAPHSSDLHYVARPAGAPV